MKEEILDIVSPLYKGDENLGFTTYTEAHRDGLRHRSVQILMFDDENLERILVVERSQGIDSPGKLHLSAGGHVKSGQTYLEAAMAETNEELFSGQGLPSDLRFIEIARYQNDTRPTNKENTVLFKVVYRGRLNPDPSEVASCEWKKIDNIRKDMVVNPDKYTTTFRNTIQKI